MNDIEKMFYQECRDKKIIGCNIHKRASRLGYIRGGIRTQSDFLSNKERKKLNGEVKVSYMYSELVSVPSFDEIIRMENSQAKNILSLVKHNFTNKQLVEHWGISVGKMYGAFERYGIHQKKKKNATNKQRKIREVKPIVESKPVEIKPVEPDNNYDDLKNMILEMQNSIENIQKVKVETEKISESGFKIEFTGEYTKEDVENRIISIAGVMVAGKQYKVKIVLEEV